MNDVMLTPEQQRTMRNRDRMLAVIYDLADGEVGRPIEFSAILRRVNELDAFNMTDAQLHEYTVNTRKRVMQMRAERAARHAWRIRHA